MGWDDFWTAMQQIYVDYALDIVTAYDMLRTWQAYSATDLRPLYDRLLSVPVDRRLATSRSQQSTGLAVDSVGVGLPRLHQLIGF